MATPYKVKALVRGKMVQVAATLRAVDAVRVAGCNLNSSVLFNGRVVLNHADLTEYRIDPMAGVRVIEEAQARHAAEHFQKYAAK